MTRTAPGISSPEVEIYRTDVIFTEIKLAKDAISGQLKILSLHFDLLKISS